MGLWTLHSILFVALLGSANGQWFNGGIRPHRRDRPPPLFRDMNYHVLRPLKLSVSSAPRFTLLAPDLLRTDSQENIYLQADGLSDPVTASISVLDFGRTPLLHDSVTLNQENGFHALVPIQVPSDRLNPEEKKNKFVYLKVDFGTFHSLERVLMVSFHSGYIFIQTDKPIYNPGDTVRFRAFVSSPSFKAFEGSITIDIQNPDGVVVKQIPRVRAVDGVYGETYPLSEHVNEGLWTMTAKFDHREQNTFTSKFQVKKYVLPAFNVTLTPKKSFLSLDDTELEVEITANYLYGEPVQWKAYVVFGVKINQDMIRLPSVKQASHRDGGVVRLSMDEIKRAFPNVASLVGNSVYVKASVLTESGSDLVEAEKTGITIVDSPYIISFKDMPKYFKPQMPLDFTIQVGHHGGPPPRSIPVKLSFLDAPLIVNSGSTRASINMPSGRTSQTIIAETAQPGLRPEQQAKAQVTIHPYSTFDHRQWNYLYISAGTNRVTVGSRLSLTLSISNEDQSTKDHIKHVTYLVLNKGKIIAAERIDVTGQVFSTVGLTVTAEMMPSFRIVAFYSIPWEGNEEVVSDSIWVDVADSCVGKLTVEPTDGIHRNYMPGKTFRFRLKGDPGAKVSLVAVDNAVYLLSKERLTQTKIWDVVEHRDLGCTRGGGRDAKAVFSDAGLLYASSARFQTRTRQAMRCPSSTRSRRSAEMMRRKAQLENHYKEALERRCCNDGLREIPMPYSCTRRSLYITEGWECMRAFRYCCATYRNQEFNTEIPTTPPPMTTAPTKAPATTTRAPRPTFPIMHFAQPPLIGTRARKQWIPAGPEGRMFGGIERVEEDRSVMFARTVERERAVTFARTVEEEEEEEEEEDNEWEYMDVAVRSKFYESWLWMDVDLPTQVDRNGLAFKDVVNPLPDSITEWGVLAISSSPQTGFCVAEPYNIKAWKQFFVDLKLPYSVARNEQIEIKAVIYNYGYEDLQVMVMLMKTEKMCSVAFKDRHTQRVTVQAGSSVVVPYTVVPLEVGKLPLEVMVNGGDIGGDRIQKSLRVVMDGVQKTKVFSTVLNPSSEGGTQTVRVANIEVESVVPNSVPETVINVRGNVLADSIDNSISEDSLASLIRMPGGCVEQNLASMTLPLIAYLYLERTDKWEGVGVERKAEALRYIRRGYENQLAYRKSDGSYPPYRKEGASTWITAYVVKVFSMAHSVAGVDEQQVCGPLLYLMKNKHRILRGDFVESNPVYSTTMTGGLRGDDPELTLTAFVSIALAEAKQAGIRCDDPSINLESARRKTADYLKRALVTLGRRPYTVAIASYALALLGKDARYDPTQSLLRAAGPGRNHWPDSHNTLFTLEATGYALLALVKMGRMDEAAAPFQWLNSQRRMGGGFGSTQSTMVVLQALSEYLINKPPPDDLRLDVDVRIAGRKDIRYHFNPNTAYAARSSRLPANMALEVEARGNGQGILEVVTYYNQLHEVDEKLPCKDFEFSVAIEESSEKPPEDVEKSYQLTIKVRSLGPRDVRMVVLDISLPTGFTPENSDLERLSNSVDRYINNFQIVDNLSDRGSLIIHLFKVSHKEPEILVFRLQQRFKVGLLQPSSVTVYEYYNPDHRCSRTYTPREDKEALNRICRDNSCRCTHGDCCVSKTDSENFSNKDRETFACKSLHHVFKVKVLNVTQSYYDKYEMEITQDIKLGVEPGVEVGMTRFFMSHGGCRDRLDLQQGSEYLIIGPKDDVWNLDGGRLYMLGKDTWVERWPSPAECSSNVSLQAKCSSLSEMANELYANGCSL